MVNRETQLSESLERHGFPAIGEVTIQETVEKERDVQYEKLDCIISQYAREPGQLIRILHQAQDIFGYLPVEVQSFIAEKLEIPVSEVNGVVTFYSLFSSNPKGKHMLNLCMGTACYVKGAQELMDTLKDTLSIDEGETTPDRLFTLKSTRCIGACGLAPILVVDGNVRGKATPGDIVKIIEKYRKGEKSDRAKH